MVAKMLEQRRDFSVLEVIKALDAISQPNLLVSRRQEGALVTQSGSKNVVETIIAPISRSA